MGLKAEVHFAGYIFKILVFYRRMHQAIDEVNKPIGRPTGHLIDLVLESSNKTDEFAAWLVGQGMKELKIVFSPVTGNGKSRTILLRDAYCVFFKEDFKSTTAYPMTSMVAISAGIVDDGSVIHFEYWKVSDIHPPKFESKSEVVLTPKISKITWIDTKSQEKTEETIYSTKIALAVKIANHKSGTATIKIEKEDGSEFEKGVKSFTYVESVDEDGIAEISEIDIKEQWEEFKTTDIDKLVAKVEYYGAKKTSKPLEVKPSPKVLVNFRVHNAYKGEFGFDWLRMGDTGKPGDEWYKDIIGSYKTGSFVQDKTAYTKLGKKFDMKNTHPIKPKDKYVVPILALLPNKSAKLTLKVEIKDNDAKKIEFIYDDKLLTLDKKEVSYKSIGKKTLPDELTITAKEFSSDQFIKVLADGKFAGKLKVIANDKAHRRKAKIVFVHVTTELVTGIENTGASIDRKKELTKYLNQGLVKPKIDAFSPLSLDFSKKGKSKLYNGTTFNQKFAPNGVLTKANAKSDAIQDFLNNALQEKYKNQKDYSSYYKIYFINEGKNIGLYGRSYGIPSTAKSVVVYTNGFLDSTLVHETLHAMGLYHSFSNKGEFTFEKFKTDSIMDYSDIAPKPFPVLSTWQWQWKILWNNLK